MRLGVDGHIPSLATRIKSLEHVRDLKFETGHVVGDRLVAEESGCQTTVLPPIDKKRKISS